MTKRTLAELRKEAEELAIKLNEARLEGKEMEALDIRTDINKIIVEYTEQVCLQCFEHCKNSDDAMLEAVKLLSFMTITAKDVHDNDSILPKCEIVDKAKRIDLVKLDKYCGGIGKDKNWYHKAQKFNMLLTAKVAGELGYTPKRIVTEINDSFAMSKIAQSIDLGNNPTSNTNMLKTLRALVSSMIGEEFENKVTSHDVRFLRECFTKKSNKKALSIACTNNKGLCVVLADICHKAAFGGEYDVESREIKK